MAYNRERHTAEFEELTNLTGTCESDLVYILKMELLIKSGNVHAKELKTRLIINTSMGDSIQEALFEKLFEDHSTH